MDELTKDVSKNEDGNLIEEYIDNKLPTDV